jgi:hypothetical protein
MDGETIKVWCLLRDQHAHVKPVEEHFGERAQFVYDEDWVPEKLLEHRADIVVCVNDFYYDVARCLDAARGHGIPSLVLQDGILEWRCQYENPRFGAGGGAPQHQPVIADKIACIGNQSARQIAAWGNCAKVEVTGMPRLDALLERRVQAIPCPGHRVLVMTAKKPWFTPAHQELIVRSLLDVKAYLGSLPGIETVWRVTKNLGDMLGVENRLQELGAGELASVLSGVDAVISTPSTALLETMLMGKPVAALDYPNVPRFVPTAWTISAPEHIPPVVAELLDPPANKLAFQRDCLEDCLRCDGPAAPRVANLIVKMVCCAREARLAGRPLCLEPDLLGNGTAYAPDHAVSLAALYPENPVFQERDIEALQVRLVRAEHENARLKESLAERGIRYWASAALRYVARRVGRKRSGSKS